MATYDWGGSGDWGGPGDWGVTTTLIFTEEQHSLIGSSGTGIRRSLGLDGCYPGASYKEIGLGGPACSWYWTRTAYPGPTWSRRTTTTPSWTRRGIGMEEH